MCNVSYVSRQASSGSDGQASAATLSILGEGIVGIAVQPTLARLRRSDHRVPAGAGMLRGVAVGRVVAAERGAALLTRSEMHPVPADLHALVTHPPLRLLDRRNRGQVRTGSNRRHACPLLLYRPVCEAYQERGPLWGGAIWDRLAGRHLRGYAEYHRCHLPRGPLCHARSGTAPAPRSRSSPPRAAAGSRQSLPRNQSPRPRPLWTA